MTENNYFPYPHSAFGQDSDYPLYAYLAPIKFTNPTTTKSKKKEKPTHRPKTETEILQDTNIFTNFEFDKPIISTFEQGQKAQALKDLKILRYIRELECLELAIEKNINLIYKNINAKPKSDRVVVNCRIIKNKKMLEKVRVILGELRRGYKVK